MTDERKVQLGVEVDATGAKKGFGEVANSAQDMANSVAQAGEKAAAGLESGMVQAVKRATAATGEASQQVMTWAGFLKQNMGPAMKEALDAGATGAEAHSAAIRKIAAQWQEYKQSIKDAGSSDDNFSASQTRLIDSIKRQSVQLTEGKAAWLEYRASQLGVSDAVAPYIAKIRETEKAHENLGKSAKEMEWALRGVPAQFTDIVVSLTSGQRPMTVLLQQGGQLKDLFGGIGPAARALGGYIVGLINPFTLAAAATVGLAVAYNQGSKEADEYRKALILTGNAAGTTSDQLSDMATRISKSVGTKGSAAAALAELANTGKVAAGNLEYFSAVAVKMERTVGQSAQDTAKDFAELGKAPLEASERLNEKYNYLTAAVYAQIKALQEQGRTEDAAATAQQAYARAFDDRTKEITANLGLIDRALNAQKDAWKSFWDSVQGIGREKTQSERSTSLSDQIAAMQKQIAISGPNGRASLGSTTTFGQELAALQERQAAEQELQRIQKRGAEVTAAQNAQEQARIQWMKDGDKFLSKRAQMEREITKAETEGAAAGIAREEINKRIAQIREKYKGDKGETNHEVADLKAKLKAEQDYLAALQTQGGAAKQLNDGEKDAIKYAEQLKGKIDAKTRARLEELKAISQQRAAVLDETDNAKRAIKATEEAEKAHVKYNLSLASGLDKMKEDVEKQKEHNAQIGLSKEAIAALEAAKLDEQATTLEGIAIKQMDKNLDSEQYDLLMAQAKALRDLASAKRGGAAKQASFDAAEEHRKAWEKANDQISQSLTDAIMRGGKSAGEYLKDYFRTLILRPVVQMIANPIAGAINSAFGAPANGFSQGASYINAGTSLYNGYMGMSSMGNTAAQLYQYGSTALSGGTAAVSTGAAGTGWVSAEGGASYLSTGASSIGSAFSTAVPYLAAAYAIYSIAKSLDHSGTYHTGALAEYNAITGLQTGSNGTHAGPRAGDTNYGTGFGGVDFSQQTADFVGGVSKSIVGILDSTATSFGKQAGYSAATAFADDTSKDGAWGALRISLGGQSILDWQDSRNSKWAPHEFADGQAGQEQYLKDISQSVRTALDGIGLPGWAQSMLDNLGDAPALTDLSAVVDKINAAQKALVSMGNAIAGFASLSDSAVTALITASGGVDAFSANMAAFYDGYYSEAEKMANVSSQVQSALSAVGLAMPATREGFRALVQAELALGEAGAPAVVALLKVSGAFGTVADYSKRLADEAIANAQRQAEETAKAQADAVKAAHQTALDDAMKGVDVAFSAVQRAIDAERKTITDAYNAQVESFNTRIQDVTGSVSKLTSLSNSLRSAVDRMRLPDQAASDRASATAQIQSVLAIAKAGGIFPDAESIASALNTISQPFDSLFGSAVDYKREFMRQKDMLAQLADLTDSQKSIEQKTLDALQDQLKTTQDGYKAEMTRLDNQLSFAQQQVDILNGIDTHTMSVAAAIAGLQIKIGAAQSAQAVVAADNGALPNSINGLYENILGRAPDATGAQFWQNAMISNQNYQTGAGSIITDFINGAITGGTGDDAQRAVDWAREHHIPGFAVGTNLVPQDMLALIHKDERVVPAADNRVLIDTLRNPQANSAALVEEIRALREEVAKLRADNSAENRSIAQHASKTAKTLDRLSPDGASLSVKVEA